MINTHIEDCIHSEFYDGPEECAANIGIWSQPQGTYVHEAKSELEDVPWCRVRELAWLLQAADE